MQVWMLMLIVLGLGVSCAAAGEVDVYVTFSKKGMPIYTDRPSEPQARPVFSYRARPPQARAAFSRPTPARSAPDFESALAHAHQAAHRHRLDPALVMAVIDVESRFRSNALSPAGAMGLMQLMPQTARRFGVSDPWEPRANIDGGTQYLRYLIDLFDGDVRLALAGYNAGEGSVIAAGRRVPSFQETQRYVPAVLDRFKHWTKVLRDQVRD